MNAPPDTIELKLEFSEQGCGCFRPPKGARITLYVNPDDSNDMMKEVSLRGDREGFRALAAAILATSESLVDGYHLHIDEGANGPVFRSPQGYTLTIERFEK